MHTPVLLPQTLDLLAPRPGETIVDLTAGRGGHAAALAERLEGSGRVVLFDLDAGNLEAAAAAVAATGVDVEPINASFVAARRELTERGWRADAVLGDLGFSSNQMDDPERGMSFLADGPLDMRLGRGEGRTAADLLATLDERSLRDLIFRYGEEPLAGTIARNLVRTREETPINTTAMLARLVVESYGARARTSRTHPATRTFMALRIAVNDELGALDGLLDEIVRGAEAARTGGWLMPGARLAIISFHSLEDRRVKHVFADIARRGLATRLTRKPVTADEQEVLVNARARSAKLRAVCIDG